MKLSKIFSKNFWSKYVEKNSIHKLCPRSVLKHSLVHFQGLAMKFDFLFQKMLPKSLEK